MAKQQSSNPSWWESADRAGFTLFAASTLNQPIPLDDVSNSEVQIIQRRQDVMATLIGIQQGKSNRAVRSAEVNRN
jgi:hypothetical protein